MKPSRKILQGFTGTAKTNIPTPELLKAFKEIKVRCDLLENELRELKNDFGLSSNETKVGLMGLSSEIDATNKDIKAQERKSTEKQA